jgi:dihydroorotase
MRIDDEAALDLVIRGGRIIDPGSGTDALLDVGIRYGRITAIAPDLRGRIAEPRTSPPMDAGTLVIDATDSFVSPGFVDIHTHVYVGVCRLTVPADEAVGGSGTTTVVSAGDAGANTIEGFRRLTVDASRTRVLAFIHVSSVGLAPWPAGESIDLDVLDVPAAVRAARENPDIVVGVKVRMGAARIIGANGLEPLRRAIQIAEATDLPVMMHIGNCERPIGELLGLLRPGDIVTHCFAGSKNTLIEEGRVAPAALEARRRGVLFDVGHGNASFSYDTAEIAFRDGFFPDTISTDLHALSANGPVFDLPTTMAKFLGLGMSLSGVIAAVTSNAARAIRRESMVGAVEVGRSADLAIFRDGPEPGLLRDSLGNERQVDRQIRVAHTIRAGISWQSPVPYPGRGVGLARP